MVSAHDLSEGGLAVALAECAIGSKDLLGAQVDCSSIRALTSDLRTDALLFGETQSRVIVTVKTDMQTAFMDCAKRCNVSYTKIGECGGTALRIDDLINSKVEELYTIYEEAIPRRVSSRTR